MQSKTRIGLTRARYRALVAVALVNLVLGASVLLGAEADLVPEPSSNTEAPSGGGYEALDPFPDSLSSPLPQGSSTSAVDPASGPVAPGAVGEPSASVVTTRGLTGNCSRDVTPALLRLIRAAPNGSTISFVRGACYRIDGSLRISDRRGLTFEGNGAVFKAVSEGDQARRHFWFWGGSDITIRNLTIVGANPHAGTSQEAYRSDRAFQHAFAFQGTSNVLVENVRAYDVYGDFVYLGRDPRNRSKWSRNITVRNSRFERNGRQGIAITAAENVTISKNYLGDIRRATFDLEPNSRSGGARNVRIVNNTTGRGRLLWLASGGQGYNVSDIYIAGNRMTARTGTPVIKVVPPDNGAVSPAITDRLRGPFVIENNRFIVGGSPAAGFHFLQSTDVIFRNNRVSFPARREMTAVRVRESHTVRVTDNIFRGAARVLDADNSSVGCLEANNQT